MEIDGNGGRFSRGGGERASFQGPRGGRFASRDRGGRFSSNRDRGGRAPGTSAMRICKFGVRGSCNNQNCTFSHAITLIHSTHAHSEPIKTLACTQDVIFTGSCDGTIKMWDKQSMSQMNQFDAGGAVQHMEFVAPSFLLWSMDFVYPSSKEPVGRLHMMDLSTGNSAECKRSEDLPYAHPMPIQSFIATLINNCLFVVSGGGEGMIRTWSFNNGVFNHLLALEGHIRGVTSLAFVGNRLWSGSTDTTIRCWDPSCGQTIGILSAECNGHTDAVTCMETVPYQNSVYVVSGGMDMEVIVWNENGEQMNKKNVNGVVTCLRGGFDSTGNPILLIGLATGSILVDCWTNMTTILSMDSSAGLSCNGVLWTIISCGDGSYANAGCDGKLIVWRVTEPLMC